MSALVKAFEFTTTWLSRALWLMRWPLPNHAGYRALVVLLLAMSPFVPLERIALDPVRWILASIVVTCALWAFLDRTIASLQIAREGRLTIRAKQVGLTHDFSTELKELHSSPWSGLPLVLFIVLVIGCTVVISTSSITHSLIHHFGLRGPFLTPSPTRLEVFLFFADEAGRGLTFRLLDELGVRMPAKLLTAGYWQFSLLLWLFKAAITLLTVQAAWLAITSWLADTDPEVKRLWENIKHLNGRIFEFETQKMAGERRRIFALQRQHSGKLNPHQVHTLKEQLDFLRNWYEEEACGEIRDSLRWDRKVRGLFEFARRGRRRHRRDRWDD